MVKTKNDRCCIHIQDCVARYSYLCGSSIIGSPMDWKPPDNKSLTCKENILDGKIDIDILLFGVHHWEKQQIVAIQICR